MMKKRPGTRDRGDGQAPGTGIPASGAPVLEDPRFAVVHSDPRFKRFPKSTTRVEIDQRFKSALSDTKFKRKTGVDKRGRKTRKKEQDDDMRRFYRLPQNEADKGDEAELRQASDESDSDEDEEVGGLQQSLRRGLRGSVSRSSSGDDSGDEDSADDMGDVDEISSGEEGVIAQFVAGEEEHVDMIERTRRLAVVDLDWERIRAVDIFAILRSFLPNGGTIRHVTVYPSDFGLQRMAEEEVHGPKAAFGEECDSDAEPDPERLRKYERDRLRYHYAVVEFDSLTTAAAVYDQCDGLEFERSSTKLDLRFVPDGQSFAGRAVRDTATEVPSSYVPVEYTAKALQQTRVQLTWDADDPDRKKVLRRKVTADQLKEEDFAAYLGSGSEEDDADETAGAQQQQSGRHQQASRLRALLLGETTASTKGRLGTGIDEDGGGGDDDLPASMERLPSVMRGGDMVVSFGVGLEERMAAKRAQAAGQAPPETVWQAHLRERKAKRVAAKQAAQTASTAQDDAGFDDPFFTSVTDVADVDALGQPQTSKHKKKGKLPASGSQPPVHASADREDRRRKAELELLMMDDTQVRAGRLPVQDSSHDKLDATTSDDKGHLSRKQARAAAKAARRRNSESDEEAGLDTSDPRFAALFTRPDFALDPTDPRMKGLRSAEVIHAKRRSFGLSNDPVAGGSSAHQLQDVVTRLKQRRATAL